MSAIESTSAGAAAAVRAVERLEETHVGTEMSTGVVSCAPGETALALAGRMANHHTHAVVIAGLWDDASGHDVRWGLIAHDTVAATLAEGRQDQVAADLATGKIITCGPHESMLEAAKQMSARGVDHLVVLDGEDPVGVISTLDVMRVATR